MCIILENAIYAAACVAVCSHFGCQKSSLHCFSCVLGSFWINSAIMRTLRVEEDKNIADLSPYDK